jgi:hypothetical protein
VPSEKANRITGLLLDNAISSTDIDVETRSGAENGGAREARMTLSMNDDWPEAGGLDQDLNIRRLRLNSEDASRHLGICPANIMPLSRERHLEASRNQGAVPAPLVTAAR